MGRCIDRCSHYRYVHCPYKRENGLPRPVGVYVTAVRRNITAKRRYEGKGVVAETLPYVDAEETGHLQRIAKLYAVCCPCPISEGHCRIQLGAVERCGLRGRLQCRSVACQLQDTLQFSVTVGCICNETGRDFS